MYEELLELDLPKKYKENLIKYKLGLDSVPEWPIFLKKGWTFEKYLKLETLVGIEHMKSSLKEAVKNDELTEAEIQECNDMIANAINKYNKI